MSPKVEFVEFAPVVTLNAEYAKGDHVRITYDGIVSQWDQRTQLMTLTLTESQGTSESYHHMLSERVTVTKLVPATYKGVPIPETLVPNWDQPEAEWWRRGVDSSKGEVNERTCP